MVTASQYWMKNNWWWGQRHTHKCSRPLIVTKVRNKGNKGTIDNHCLVHSPATAQRDGALTRVVVFFQRFGTLGPFLNFFFFFFFVIVIINTKKNYCYLFFFSHYVFFNFSFWVSGYVGILRGIRYPLWIKGLWLLRNTWASHDVLYCKANRYMHNAMYSKRYSAEENIVVVGYMSPYLLCLVQCYIRVWCFGVRFRVIEIPNLA